MNSILRREYAGTLQLIVRQDGDLFEYLVLRQTTTKIDRAFALARDLEFTEAEAVQMGEFYLDYHAQQLSAVAERATVYAGRQEKGGDYHA